MTNEQRRLNKKWVRENYQTMKLKEMANHLDVNIDCIAQYLKEMKLVKYKGVLLKKIIYGNEF